VIAVNSKIKQGVKASDLDCTKTSAYRGNVKSQELTPYLNTGALVESYQYDVFGTPSFFDANGVSLPSSIISNRFLFTGREYDAETGLYHYRARCYSPSLGRFLQRDPRSYVDGMNLYQYVRSNPINFTDPYGLCAKQANAALANLLARTQGGGANQVDSATQTGVTRVTNTGTSVNQNGGVPNNTTSITSWTPPAVDSGFITSTQSYPDWDRANTFLIGSSLTPGSQIGQDIANGNAAVIGSIAGGMVVGTTAVATAAAADAAVYTALSGCTANQVATVIIATDVGAGALAGMTPGPSAISSKPQVVGYAIGYGISQVYGPP